MNEHFFIYNDQFFHLNQPALTIDNRSLRYGDGLFETMRMHEGRILLFESHLQRLFHGLKILQFDCPESFNGSFLSRKISELLQVNGNPKNARIRLMIFRSNAGLFDTNYNVPGYIIETAPLSGNIELNENGLEVDLFPGARKSNDPFSNLKSNNYLPSVMAALYAGKNKLDDALVLNVFDRICESAIANIFIIKDHKIYTPPLSEGCVAGVMRRWMLEFPLYELVEKELSIQDVRNADEFFLTNSVYLIKWVKKFKEKTYAARITKEIHAHIIQKI